MRKLALLLTLAMALCFAATASAGEPYRFYCDYFKSIEYLKSLRDRGDALDAISDSLSDSENQNRFVEHYLLGLEDLEAARMTIGTYQNSSHKIISQAVEYIDIAFQLQENHNRSMIAYLTNDEAEPDGPEYQKAMDDIKASWDLFKDASKLARYALMDTSRLDDNETITHFSITRAQRQDLLNRIYDLFGDNPEKTYRNNKRVLEYQGVAFMRHLNDERFKCADED